VSVITAKHKPNNMKPLTKTLLAFTACAIAFVGCKKDDPVSNAVNTPSSVSNIHAALRNNAPDAQLFQVNAQFPTPIYSENGASYLFTENAFLLPNGNVAMGMYKSKLLNTSTIVTFFLRECQPFQMELNLQREDSFCGSNPKQSAALPFSTIQSKRKNPNR